MTNSLLSSLKASSSASTEPLLGGEGLINVVFASITIPIYLLYGFIFLFLMIAHKSHQLFYICCMKEYSEGKNGNRMRKKIRLHFLFFSIMLFLLLKFAGQAAHITNQFTMNVPNLYVIDQIFWNAYSILYLLQLSMFLFIFSIYVELLMSTTRNLLTHCYEENTVKKVDIVVWITRVALIIMNVFVLIVLLSERITNYFTPEIVRRIVLPSLGAIYGINIFVVVVLVIIYSAVIISALIKVNEGSSQGDVGPQPDNSDNRISMELAVATRKMVIGMLLFIISMIVRILAVFAGSFFIGLLPSFVFNFFMAGFTEWITFSVLIIVFWPYECLTYFGRTQTDKSSRTNQFSAGSKSDFVQDSEKSVNSSSDMPVTKNVEVNNAQQKEGHQQEQCQGEETEKRIHQNDVENDAENPVELEQEVISFESKDMDPQEEKTLEPKETTAITIDECNEQEKVL